MRRVPPRPDPRHLRPAAVLVGALTALSLVGRPAAAQWSGNRDEFTAPRNATVDARGARQLTVEAKAGELRIRGVDGLTEVRVRATARASSRALLAEIQLVARREGNAIVVRADIPDWPSDRGYDDDHYRGLDLVLEVPRGIAADVQDGSGGLEIRGVGALTLVDGSGEIDVEDVASARITDGSGELRLRDVRGNVRITDGSGAIDVSRVKGDVVVTNDGSGGMDVRDVAGDFVVEGGRGRGIRYSDVRGRVRVPQDERAMLRDRERARDREIRARARQAARFATPIEMPAAPARRSVIAATSG